MTKAQADALRHLADALAYCEALDISLGLNGNVELFYGERGVWIDVVSLHSNTIRQTADSTRITEDGK